MQLKIFTGPPETLQQLVSDWMQQHKHRVSHVLQSQSTAVTGEVLLTISLFYEEASIGSGLGFRRSS